MTPKCPKCGSTMTKLHAVIPDDHAACLNPSCNLSCGEDVKPIAWLLKISGLVEMLFLTPDEAELEASQWNMTTEVIPVVPKSALDAAQQALAAEQAGSAAMREALEDMAIEYCRYTSRRFCKKCLGVLVDDGHKADCIAGKALSASAGAAMLERVRKAEDLLRQLRGWDVMDAMGDGTYWRSEIDKVLNPTPNAESE